MNQTEKNTDKDAEIQDPLKAVTKSVISDMEDQITQMQEEVKQKVEEIGRKTIKKTFGIRFKHSTKYSTKSYIEANRLIF